jgi:hypothetical protein
MTKWILNVDIDWTSPRIGTIFLALSGDLLLPSGSRNLVEQYNLSAYGRSWATIIEQHFRSHELPNSVLHTIMPDDFL